ncbi:MAG: ABC transporter ATP-binding protein, partial [Eubacterium sp.]|nr:ABC transporter ATP-binding protein [Eubacterium sp.]
MKTSKIGWLWENMRGYRCIYVIGLLGSAVNSVMQLTVPFFTQQIVDLFLTGPDAASNLTYKRDLFFQLIAAMVLLTFLRTLIVYLACMDGEYVSQKILYHLRTTLFHKIEHQDMMFYSMFRTGDLMTRMTGDLDAVRHMIAWVIRTIVESLSLFLAAAGYFLYMDWLLALCMLIIAPLILVIIVHFKNRVAPQHRELREKLSRLNTAAQENIAGTRVVKAFAREPYEIEKFDDCNRDYSQTNKKTALTWLVYFPYVETLANLMPVVLLAVGGMFIINGRITMGEYVAFSGLIWAVANPMRQLGNVMNEFQRFSAASEKIME